MTHAVILCADMPADISHRQRRWFERVEGRFMGEPLDVTPEEAILGALHIAAGEVDYCNRQIAKLSEMDLFEFPTKERYVEMPSGKFVRAEVSTEPEQLTRWVLIRDSALDRMAKFARMAAEMNVEERQIKIAERHGELVADFMQQVIDELNLTPEQYRRVGPAMRSHLKLLQGAA